MKPLQKLWQSLEDFADGVAVMSEWRARLGLEFQAVATLLRPTDKYADSFPDVGDPNEYYKAVEARFPTRGTRHDQGPVSLRVHA